MIPLFMHIPKAAGSTLTHWIYASFRSDAPQKDKFFVEGGFYYYPSGYVNCTPGQKPAQIQRNFRDPNLRAVVGHFRYGIHRHIPQPSAYVTVLRDPIERLVSLYYFHRLVQDKFGSLDGVILPEDMNLRDFAKTPLYPEADNGQMRRLSGFAGEIGGCTRDHLELAKQQLADFAVVGFSDQIPKVIDAISRVFKVANDTSLYAVNENPQSSSMSISPGDIEQIAASNCLDLELYEFARTKMLRTKQSSS